MKMHSRILAVVFGLLSTTLAHAITLYGVPPYEIYNNALYYSYCPLTMNSGYSCDTSDFTQFIDHSTSDYAVPFHFVNPTSTTTPDIGNNTDQDTAPDDLLVFYVLVDAATTGSNLVVSVFAKSNDTSVFPGVPIYAADVVSDRSSANPTLCSDSQGQCTGKNTDSKYFGVKATAGNFVRIGIRMYDLCAYANSAAGGSVTADGCSGASATAPSSTSTIVSQTLYVEIGEATAVGSALASKGSGSQSQTLKIVFQYGGPATSCSDLGNLYAPRDGAIALKSGVISPSSVNSAAAPVKNLLAVANLGTAVYSADSTYESNSIVERTGYGNDQWVTGFSNTTDGSDNEYTVAVAALDASGMVGDLTTCQVQGVQTSKVFGIVSKGNCFIATGAFREESNPSLSLLRMFRDEVLLQSSWGKLFVRSYYKFSPPAALWLVEHPWLRFPVFLFLAIVQAVAWIALHTALLLTLLLVGMGLIVFGWIQRPSEREIQ